MATLTAKSRFASACAVAALFVATVLSNSPVAADEETRSYLIQGTRLSSTLDAVRQVGGEVTHELNVINAVGAELTDAQREMLTRDGLRVMADQALGIDSSTATVRDEFTVVSWTENDGTTTWSGGWVEIGDYNPSASSGNVKVYEPQQMAQLRKPDNGLLRSVNLPVDASASLGFDYRRIDFGSASDVVHVQISNDSGATWTTLDSFAGPADDSGAIAASYDISAHATNGTAVRFITDSAFTNTNGPKFRLDNVEISYSTDTVSTDVQEHVLDTFSSLSYSNNDGSVDWVGDWVDSEGAGPTAGGIKIGTNGSIKVISDNAILSRTANLSEAASATLTFDYKRDKIFNEADEALLEVTSNGGVTWVELDRFGARPATQRSCKQATTCRAMWQSIRRYGFAAQTTRPASSISTTSRSATRRLPIAISQP